MNRKYTLDSNIFIEANRRYYAFDLCPGFWEAIIAQNSAGIVHSVDRVHGELVAGKDQLCNWAKTLCPQSFFQSTDQANVLTQFGNLATWVQSQTQFTPEAKSEFAASADGWVVAHALTNSSVVVTHEVYAAEVRRNVPIPNLCKAFNVSHMNTFDMLRELKTKFVLQQPSKA